MNQPEPRERLKPKRPEPQKRSLFLPLFLLGVFFVLLAGLAFFAFFAMSFRPNKPVKVASKSVLSLNVSGLIPEYVPPNAINVLLDKRPIVFLDYLHMVNTARRDDRIEGILLNVGPSSLSWAQIQELRNALLKFQESGKWVISFGEIWQDQEYYLASVANESYLAPEGILLVDGLMIRTTFYGDAFEKYGIRVHVEAIGKYKAFADSYRRNGMSEPHRESMEALLQGIENQVVEDIAQSRNLEKAFVEQNLENTLYELNKATELGFIDGTSYKDQMHKMIAEKVGIKSPNKVRLIDGGSYLISRPEFGRGGSDKVALIYAVGTIQSGAAQQGMFGGTVIGSDSFIASLKAARENPNVKAIVLRIDSPGGSSLASDVMWREIKRTSEMGKPIIASLGGVAASGGYYMAMACDKIVTQPTTMTGSIGVISMRVDFEKLYENFLVNVDVVKTGSSADFFDPHRGLRPEEVDSLHRRVEVSYKNFVEKAALSRGREYQEFETFAQGRVWVGTDALDHGLVDSFGGIHKAIELAALEAKISDYGVVTYPLEEDFWTMLRNNQLALAAAKKADLSGFAKLIPDQAETLIDYCLNQSKVPTHLLALTPFHIEIR